MQSMKARRHPWIAAAVVPAVLASLILTAGAFIVPTTTQPAAAPAPAPAPVASPTPGPTAAPATDAAPSPSIQLVIDAERSVDDLDQASASQFGAAVLDRATGQLEIGANGATPFYSASVVKLYTAVAILHRVEVGEVTLSPGVTGQIQRALSLSDDNAMNALWSGFGGSATVTQTIALAGLTDSSPPSDPSQWGEAKVSARDVAAVYDYVLTSLQPANRDLIMNSLGNAADRGADGFDQAFGLLAAPRTAGVAAKQGWMWYGSSLYLHSAGVFGADQRFVVAVLTKNPAGAGQGAASRLVTKATDGVEAALSKA